jgi:putative transposase
MTQVMARKTATMKLMDAMIGAGVKVNVTRWCEESGMSRRTWYRHKKRIEQEGAWQPRSRRPRTSPGATPPQVVTEIVRLRKELAPDNGADAILAALRELAAAQDWARQGLRVPHRSTVNKVLSREGLVTPEPKKRPRSSYRRFAYARPRDCYQIDATQVKLADGTPAVVFDVLDDCTRLLAACHAADAETAAAAHAAITTATAACGAPAIVLCDNGTAFGGGIARGQGEFVRAVTAQGSRLIYSTPYHPQTCGKVERHHQTLKNWLDRHPPPAPHPHQQHHQDTNPHRENNHRHHTAISTTPRHAWDTTPAHGGPGHLPRQDDATIHKLTIAPNGSIGLGGLTIHISNGQPGHHVTAIRDHGHVTVYTTDGQPIGHIRLDYAKCYQGTLTPAA